MVMDLITSYYAIGNNNVSEEGMYIFIMCYVHILQYGTATTQPTESRLHSFRARPQRSGTAVTWDTTLSVPRVQRTSLASEGWHSERCSSITQRFGWSCNGLRVDFQPGEMCCMTCILHVWGVLCSRSDCFTFVLLRWLIWLNPKTPAGLRLAQT